MIKKETVVLKGEMVKNEVINKEKDSKGRSLLKVKISRVDGHGNVGKMCLLDTRKAPPVR